MEYRQLGRTGLRVSALGFGCGAVGGLLVRGDTAEMVRTVARAVELGVNYYDTAAIYGNGTSETNLGRVLAELRPEVLVGTKVMVREDELDDKLKLRRGGPDWKQQPVLMWRLSNRGRGSGRFRRYQDRSYRLAVTCLVKVL